ncbi:MAG TPA: hypothetical protein VGE74_24835 [Gemmata sp.]
MRPISWDPAALQEFDAALAVSRDATALQVAVDEALQDIASGRITHAPLPRAPARGCVLSRLPYSIVYTETATEIRVIAFPHSSRKPGYWKNRLPKP